MGGPTLCGTMQQRTDQPVYTIPPRGEARPGAVIHRFALLPASGCPKRNRCVNPLPVSAPLLTSGCRRGAAVCIPYQCLLRDLSPAVRRGIRCENPFPVSAPLLASGCPKRIACELPTSVCSITCLRLSRRGIAVANPLPVSALLLTSGCPKRNRCANPLHGLLHYLPLSVEEEPLCELPTQPDEKRFGSACAFSL